MTEIKVDTNKRYLFTVGRQLAATAGKTVLEVTNAKQALLLSDSNVSPLYGKKIVSSLRSAGIKTFTFTLPAGEQIKNSAFLFDVLDILFHRDFCRDDVLVTLGGGTVSDLGGLAASLYMRGMRLFHIPTTLLAMVDASVGGKTAIDLPYGKNMVGTFYQPDGVIADLDFLITLPEKQLACGFAEVVKCASLDSKKMFSTLESGVYDLEDIVSQCIKIKVDLIEEDENDRGKRHLLNLGHTYAHALEAYTGYKVSHGYAVAIGIANAFRYSVSSGRCDGENHTRVCALLKKFGLPTTTKVSGKALYEEAKHDKKRSDGKTMLVLPTKIGKVALVEAGDAELEAFFGA